MLSYGLFNSGSAVTLGSNAEVESTGYDATGVHTQNEGGKTTLGDSTRIKVSSMTGVSENNAAYVTGVSTENSGVTVLGRNVVIAAEAQGKAIGISTGSWGKIKAGNGLVVTAANKGDGTTYAIQTVSNGTTEIGDDASLTAINRNGAGIAGIATESEGTTKIGKRAAITVANTGGGGMGITSYGGTTQTGNNTSITVNSIEGIGVHSENDGGITTVGTRASITVNGAGGMGIASLDRGNTIVEDNASITVTGEKSDYLGGSKGIYSLADGTTTLKNNASITVNGTEGAGIASEGGSTTVGDNASVTVNGESGAGISSTENGSTTVGKNATITVNGTDGTGIVSNNGSTAVGDNASISAAGSGVESKGAGTVTFTGGANIIGGQYSLFSQDADSLIDLTAAGGRKTIQGNMLASDGGTIKAVLDTGNSFFTGASAVEGDGSELDLDLSNGAKWNMTGDSSVTSLALNSGAVVNMTANTAYQQLSADNFSGSNGIFYMKTDLDSQTDGDKVHMTQADAGSSGKVQVYDASFVRGKEVTGTRHLLLITDDSGQASFTGETLNRGGLWDVTPTIQNGSYVRDTMGVADAKDTEWYLTKLEKKLNEDSRPLLVGGDNVYGMYRHSLDTLRQRRGNLRQRDKQEDADGIWVRDRGGRMTGDGWDSKYNIFQLGYEYSKDATSIYGIFGERGIASPDYKTGTGKEHTLAGGLYGTWFGHHDSYTDVVAKFGRDDSHISTFGPYPDSADYRTAEQSLSIEYGKTLYRGKHREFFIEPQAQLVFGHLNDVSYTTARRTHVERDDFNSTIGRLGFVLGKTHDQGRHPFDYYLKASVLHEFGNSQDVHMQSANGEMLDTSLDYGETWFTVGFGGTYRLSPSATLYADGERTFSSDITTKWQVNAGLTWQF